MSVALELVEWAGLEPVRVRSDRITLRCPFHDDRRPSAAVLASGVLVCSACARSWSPFDWLRQLGRTPAETMALLDKLGLRDGDRPERRGAGGSRATASSPPVAERPTETSQVFVGRTPRVELDAAMVERLEVARFERRRYDARLAELRGFDPDVLNTAGVAIGRPVGYGFRGPRAALDELRLLLPVRDAARRTVGLLAIAPNPTRRAHPKVLARAGSPRLLLELVDVAEPIAPVLLVTEGEVDALAAASAGIRAVGVPGVGGYGRHAARIAALVAELELEYALLVPDGDDAGRRVFRELAAAIASAGAIAVYANLLDEGADVGSFLVDAAAALERERPELSASARRRFAGRRLLFLASEAAG